MPTVRSTLVYALVIASSLAFVVLLIVVCIGFVAASPMVRGALAGLGGFLFLAATVHVYRMGWLDCSRAQGDGKDICR
jgi:hypothetical protein